MVTPYSPLRDLLMELLAQPGMEKEMDAWRDLPYAEGIYSGIWDGEIWQTLKDTEGRLFFFFGKRSDNKLGISLTVGFDE